MRHLLHAVGRGTVAAAALVCAACGSTVVADDGGTTTTGSTITGATTGTTTTTTTTTSAVACDQPATVYAQLTECIPKTPGDPCWPADAPVVYGKIYTQLENQSCGGDLAAVLCGPDESVKGMCCYVVDGIHFPCGP